MVTEDPPEGATRWTMEALAEAMADHGVPISASQAWRICKSLDLKPWQVESWMTSHDPDFWDKASDVCGLYLNPPAERRGVERGREVGHAGQVPHQPDQAGRARASRSAESSSTSATAPRCSSPASTSTTAASPAGSPTRPARRTSWTFLADLVRQTPKGLDLHCIADNLSAHKTGKVATFLEQNPHVHIHYTPTHASWLNQVELFFSILERRLLRRGEFASVDELADRIIAFIKDYNRRAAPFRWTYDGRPLQGRVSHNDLTRESTRNTLCVPKSTLRQRRRPAPAS